MSIGIGGYDFLGPYDSTEPLYEKAGVYVILYKNESGKYVLVDVGGSDKIKTRVTTHDRKDCWNRNSRGRLIVAVFYTTDWTDLEKLIRNQFKPTCGDR